ncbi:MAG: HAD-IA family hydrolase [Planctomycetes bacterium]|nr:HAD-IA family hydrolase [Planctomycetota bacterium]
MSAPFSTLVFDLDGTISDPSEGIARCINHALGELGQSEISRERVSAEIGPPLDEMFGALHPAADEETIVSLIGKYRERYATVGFSENSVYAEIPDGLSRLVERGFRLGVCTSKREDFAVRILDLFGLRRYFAFVNGADVGTTKREQLSRLLAAGAIDTDAVMIGDRAVDILAARGNHLRSIGVLWGFGSHEELAAAEPDFIAADVGELERIAGHGGQVLPPVVPSPPRRGSVS